MQSYTNNKTHYNSIVMLHPDGEVMCRCSLKKANWYISRGLATKIDEETFKLNFVPDGYGNRDQPFYLEVKENRCVVCGTDETLTKHHVVPYQFRSLFPDHLKSHDCHDVLLVCRKCHNIYEREADIYKGYLLRKLGYDICEVNRIKKINNQIISARLILEGNDPVPEDRIAKLEFYAAQDSIPEPKDWKELFIETYNSESSIHEFCVLWRQHFVDNMTPKYISEHFDVNHHKTT